MLCAAFYVKRGDWRDVAIRLRTASRFSHVELAIPLEHDLFRCLSSSPRDGGVRECIMNLPEREWELISLPYADINHVNDFFNKTVGLPYDFTGVLIGQALSIKFHAESRYFCSEWCAAALGLSDPWRYAPIDLYNVTRDFYGYYYNIRQVAL